MQEEVNQKTVALSIRTTKLTGKVLAAALGKVARALQKHHRKALTPQGRQSVKKLMNHYKECKGKKKQCRKKFRALIVKPRPSGHRGPKS